MLTIEQAKREIEVSNAFTIRLRFAPPDEREGLATPIIILTAKRQESVIVLGLNLGADDYVPKPFSIDVLLARANACLRRHRAAPADVFEFGDCKLDASSHKLFRVGVEVALTSKEFRLLVFFRAMRGARSRATRS